MSRAVDVIGSSRAAAGWRGHGFGVDDVHDRSRSAGELRSEGHGSWIDVLQLVTGLWLMVSPAVLSGPSELAVVKDLAVGAAVLGLTGAAVLSPRARAAQGPALILLGGTLVAASLALELLAIDVAAARQWNQVVVGVGLVCLAGARAR